MDPHAQDLVDAFLQVLEVEVRKKREKTRLMKEHLRANEAALKAKERERSMLMREKDRVLAVKEAKENLVAEFLEADLNKNFDGQKAMMDATVALMNTDGGNGKEDGGLGGIYGTINYPDEEAKTASIKGTNSDGADSSSDGGNGSD